MRNSFIALVAALAATAGLGRGLTDVQGDMAATFACEVDRRVELPAEEERAYAARLREALDAAGLDPVPQHFLLVDRSPAVQVAFVYRLTPSGELLLAGAAPVATGLPGSFEHFATPTGVFAHKLANPDFRAEGTLNENGIRGYGRQGMRVFDFGWVAAPKGWGDHGMSVMRLQVHATDPDVLEPQLGRPRSKGCVRIPASLDAFLDRYGMLDADYEQAIAAGQEFWQLPRAREITRWPGRYLVVIDSGRTRRPTWAARVLPPSREPECEAP